MDSELLQEQLRLEKEMHDGGIDRWNERNQKATEQGDNAATDWNLKLTKSFIHPLSSAITAWCKEYESKKGRPTRVLYYLNLINPNEVAFITIRQMLNAIAVRDTTSLQYLCGDIASKIEDQVRFSELRNTDAKTKKYLKKIEENLKKSRSQSYRHKRNVFLSTEKKIGHDRWLPWARTEKIQLGAFLIKMACQQLTMWDEETDTLENLFFIDEIDLSRGKIRKSSKILGITARYSEWVSEFISNTEAFHPEVGACVVPPRDWKTPFSGGFHTAKVASRNPLIKMRDKELAKTMTQAQMPKVYKAVNALQRTSWCVNLEILDVLQEVCEKRLPLAVPDLDGDKEPVNPLAGRVDLDGLKGEALKEAMSNADYDAFISWKRKKRVWHETERSRVSNVIDLGRTRKIAERYSTFDELFFCYSLDFRGRIYARASGLSPQGRDIQKGMLRFSKSKPLGAHGHYWFRIHGANVWDKYADGSKGMSKESFTVRLQHVCDKDFIAMVKSIANDPIADRSWVKADKPWQFLAWCFEYADFQSHMEDCNDSSTFKTFIACAMDGSCSGIQHYSGMLRDEVGGKAVNLVNSDKPNDIYDEVKTLALNKVMIDSKMAVAFSDSWLHVGLTRELPKKPTMTLVYGSSKLTCRDSVGEYLDDLQEKADKVRKSEGKKTKLIHDFGENRWLAEGYMSTIVWDSIGEVVVAARAAMKFIRGVAREVAKQNEPLVWTTPTGFIVKQEIFKTEGRRVDTNLLGRINFEIYEETAEICSRKMQSGSAPNFIHSYDSSHLVMAVCDMVDRGIEDLWVVHDDYGTHACQTGHLHIALRVTFVELYEDCALSYFRDEQEERLNMEIDLEVPEFGTLVLDDILESTYMFS